MRKSKPTRITTLNARIELVYPKPYDGLQLHFDSWTDGAEQIAKALLRLVRAAKAVKAAGSDLAKKKAIVAKLDKGVYAYFTHMKVSAGHLPGRKR